MPSVLFVCTANRCRSPMAMVMMRQKLASLGLSAAWQVDSAGTWTEDGLPVVAGARAVMAARGLDLSEHRSRLVNAEMLRSYHLILVMERGHKEALQVEFPAVANRVFMLSEMSGTREDVRDPFPMQPEEIAATASLIEHYLDRGMARILAMGAQTARLISPRPRTI